LFLFFCFFVMVCTQDNTFDIETLAHVDPGPCALTQADTACLFRLRAAETDAWQSVCSLARARLVAVCEFVMLVRHVSLGLLKLNPTEAYHRFMALRFVLLPLFGVRGK